MCLGENYGYQIDYFALGVVMYKIIFNRFPYKFPYIKGR